MQYQRDTSSRNAICLTGQVRTFTIVGDGLRTTLVEHVPNADLFLVANLQDTGKGGTRTHDVHEIQSIEKWKAHIVSIRTYNDTMTHPLAVSRCSSRQPGHFSHHYPHMWSIATCLEMVVAHQKQHKIVYDIVVRARFDIQVPRFDYADIQAQYTAGVVAWFSRGIGADNYFVLHRSMVLPLAESVKAFDNCTDAWVNWKSHAKRCTEGRVVTHGTECFLLSALPASARISFTLPNAKVIRHDYLAG